ncbi:N-6 DNA methylase [Streptomyces sp. NPDC002057]|uniref:N-6 DNA methylase n=1 Tax=Streptomyces sp. NPDC002057 TaxID=3154664 RepID=UPI00331B8869
MAEAVVTAPSSYGSLEWKGVWRALDALCAGVAPEVGHQLAFQVIFLRCWPTPFGVGLARISGPAEPALSSVWARLGLHRPVGPGATGGAQARRLHPKADRALAALIAEVERLEETSGLFDACLDRYSSRFGTGGDYYTPRSLARLMVGLAAPRAGDRVLDPACGSGRLLIAAEQWARKQDHGTGVLSLHGRDIRPEARRVAAMNLMLHGLHHDLGEGAIDSLRTTPADLLTDIVLVNPPLNVKDWQGGELTEDPRWRLGTPPKGNANFVWVQHVLNRLSSEGQAVVLLPDSATRSLSTAETRIRRRLVERDLLAGVVALPARLFPHTRTGTTLWLFSKDKRASGRWGRRSRVGETLFVDGRQLGARSGRSARRLTDENIDLICSLFASWRGISSDEDCSEPREVNWCRSVRQDDIARRGYDLGPGSYVQTPIAALGPAGAEGQHRFARDTLYEHFDHTARISQRLRHVLGTEDGSW